MKKDLLKHLESTEYPGRGIVIGMSSDGKKALVGYWIMGRSENSRNRVFDAIDGGIRTMPADPAKVSDAHLIIYNAVKTIGKTTIVTNGNQTDTICDYIEKNLYPGYSFEAALGTRTFEDDAPNYTPRISGAVDMNTGAYKLSILKTCEGNPESAEKQFFDYPQPVAGEGHFISTYKKSTGKALASFAGEPLRVSIKSTDASEFAVSLWSALNLDNKVSLFTREIDLETGAVNDVIINKYDMVSD